MDMFTPIMSKSLVSQRTMASKNNGIDVGVDDLTDQSSLCYRKNKLRKLKANCH